MERYAAELRERLAGIVKRDYDFDNPCALGNMRTGGEMRYLFVTNDSRTWDERSGRYRAMMEQGVPARVSGRVSGYAARPYLYEMVSGRPLEAHDEGNGDWSFDLALPAAGGAIVAISPREPATPELAVTPGSDSATIVLPLPDSEGTLKLVRFDIREPDGTRNESSGTRLVRNGRLIFQLPVISGALPGVRQIRATDLTGGRSVTENWETREETLPMEAVI